MVDKTLENSNHNCKKGTEIGVDCSGSSNAYIKDPSPMHLVLLPVKTPDIDDRKLLWSAERTLCLNDLYFLCTEVLGHEDMKGSELHIEMCAQADQDQFTKQLYLSFRGSLKTSIVTVAKSIQRILKDPNIRIAIISGSLANSAKCIDLIKKPFLYNEKLKELFPEHVPQLKEQEGTKYDWTTPFRNKHNLKEGTLEAIGPGVKLSGRHYDVLLKDDIVDPKNVTTAEQRDKIKSFDAETKMLLENPATGKEIYVGTRWHYDDLYGELEKSLLPEMVFKRSAIRKDGLATWPQRFPLHVLDEIKRSPTMGSYMFSGNYLLDPISEEDQEFKAEWIHTVCGLPNKFILQTITLDPAITEKLSGDYSAFCVVGWDEQRVLHILETHNQRLNPTGLLEKIFYYHKRYPNAAMGIEKVAFQRYLIEDVKRMQREREIYFKIIELEPHGKSKRERIRQLIPLFENNIVSMDPIKHPVLAEQLLEFPKGRHDDVLDALAYQVNLLPRVPWKDKPVIVGGDPYKDRGRPDLMWYIRQDKWLKAQKKKEERERMEGVYGGTIDVNPVCTEAMV